MQTITSYGPASRYGAAFLGAPLMAGGLFFGLSLLVDTPVDLQSGLNYRTTLVETTSLQASVTAEPQGFVMSKPDDLITIFCTLPFRPDLEFPLPEVPATRPPGTLTHTALKLENSEEYVLRASVLLRDVPKFRGVDTQQKIHLRYSVRRDGSVDPSTLVVVSSTDDHLNRRALDAVAQWKYQPAVQNDKAVVQDNVEVIFLIDPPK